MIAEALRVGLLNKEIYNRTVEMACSDFLLKQALFHFCPLFFFLFLLFPNCPRSALRQGEQRQRSDVVKYHHRGHPVLFLVRDADVGHCFLPSESGRYTHACHTEDIPGSLAAHPIKII